MKLIGLGCSISSAFGWCEYLGSRFQDWNKQVTIHNLSQGSGCNRIQIENIKDFFLENGLTSEDVIVWQLTATNRQGLRLKGSPSNISFGELDSASGSEFKTYALSKYQNRFDGNHRMTFLSHSPFNLDLTVECSPMQLPVVWSDEEQTLQDVLFMISVLRTITPNVFVFCGWDQVVAPNYLKILKTELIKRDITYVVEPLVDWCREKGLPFKLDNSHPADESSSMYGRDVLLPIISNRMNIQLPIVKL